MTSIPGVAEVGRAIPDEYAGLRIPSGDGVLQLVASRWGDRSEGDRRQLAQILIMVLEPLNEPGAHVTEDLRAICEQVVAEWVEKTSPTAEGATAHDLAPPASKARRLRLVETEGGPTAEGEWMARVVLQVGARRHQGTDRCPPDSVKQLTCSARATLAAMRDALPGLPHLEVKKLETFDAFDSLGVIVAIRVTEGDEQHMLMGVCPNAGQNIVRAVAVAILNATNRRLGTG